MNPDLRTFLRIATVPLTLVFSLAASGCQTPTYSFYVRGTQFNSAGMQKAWDPADFYRLIVDGQTSDPLKVEELPGPSLTIPAKEAADGSIAIPIVKAQIHSPCGWEDVGVVTGPGPDFGNENLHTMYVEIQWDPGVTNLVTLYVDNRASKTAANVATGERKASVPPGTSGVIEFPRFLTPKCEAARHVQLDGESIIDFPKASEEGTSYLIDTTASHCYNFRSILYGDPRAATRRKYLDPRFWKAQRVRELNVYIDYFLKETPESIAILPLEGAEVRNNLSDAPCA